MIDASGTPEQTLQRSKAKLGTPEPHFSPNAPEPAVTGPRNSRLDGSRSKQRRQRHRRYKLPRLTATLTCQEAFCAIARGCLDDLAANQQATCEGDREALHQMRIALTRLRAVRSFFSSFIPSSEWSPLKGEIKWLNKHLSRARDVDVALERLSSADDKSSRTIAWPSLAENMEHQPSRTKPVRFTQGDTGYCCAICQSGLRMRESRSDDPQFIKLARDLFCPPT